MRLRPWVSKKSLYRRSLVTKVSHPWASAWGIYSPQAPPPTATRRTGRPPSRYRRPLQPNDFTTSCRNCSRGFSQESVPMRPIFCSFSGIVSVSPRARANWSLTPPSAASRLVCIQMADRSWRTRYVRSPPRWVSSRRVCISCSCQRTFITG